MGWRYRKSISIGKGMRVNISKSGVGYSFGVPGARITKTATGKIRQTYSIPGTGISYVTESGSAKKAIKNNSPETYRAKGLTDIKDNLKYDNLESGIYDEAVKEVKKWRTVSGLVFLLSICAAVAGLFMPLLFAVAAILFVTYLCLFLTLGKLKVEYELDEEAQKAYDELIYAWKMAFTSNRIWQISQTASLKNVKENCGAMFAVDPIEIPKNLFNDHSTSVRTNIKPLVIPIVDNKSKNVGEIVVLPDRLIVSKEKHFAAIEYKNIKTEIGAQPLGVPDGHIPNDAKVVETRYLHANKDGSPDARYANNPVVPIVHYGRIDVEANNSKILSLLFSSVQTIEKYEKVLPMENLKKYSEVVFKIEPEYEIENEESSLDEFKEQPEAEEIVSTTSPNENVIACSATENFRAETTSQIETKVSEEEIKKEDSNEETEVVSSSQPTENKNGFESQKPQHSEFSTDEIETIQNDKLCAIKKLKIRMIISAIICAILSIISTMSMHKSGDSIIVEVFIFIIFCAIYFLFTALLTLLISIPCLKKIFKANKLTKNK